MELNKAVRIGDKPVTSLQVLATAADATIAAFPTTAVVAATPTPIAIAATPVEPVSNATVELSTSQSAKIREEPKLPETQAPIKKYYGRKRDGQSTSSDDDLSYEDAELTEKNKYDSQL